jgi:hypothetical protein
MRSTPLPAIAPRFSVEDRVEILRAGPNSGLVGKIVEVDLTRLVPHYWVDFSNVFRLRFVDADLGLAKKVS